MASEELKPCPFCGGPARTFPYDGTMQASCAGTFLECAGSDVTAPIVMWNQRAALARPAEAEPTIKPLQLLDPNDDEAMDWVSENAMAIRRDNGNLEFPLRALVRAYQAGKASISAPQEPQAQAGAINPRVALPREAIEYLDSVGGVEQFKPGIFVYQDAGISEMCLEDCAFIVGPEMTVRPLLRMNAGQRDIVGFQWWTSTALKPESGK